MNQTTAPLFASPQVLCAGSLTSHERHLLVAAARLLGRTASIGGGSAVALAAWALPGAPPGAWVAHVALMGIDLAVALVGRFGSAETAHPRELAASAAEFGHGDAQPEVSTPDRAACAVRGVGTPREGV